MRRPIIPPALGTAAGVWLAHLAGLTDSSIRVIMILILAGIGITSFVNKNTKKDINEQEMLKDYTKKSVFCSFFIFFILGYGMFVVQDASINKEAKHVLQNNEIRGIVTSVYDKKDYVSLLIKDESTGCRILASYYEKIENPILLTGKKISLSGEISLPKGRRNPHCFDYAEYLKSKGICAVMNVKYYEVHDTAQLLPAKFAKWKHIYLSRLGKYIDEELLGLVNAVVFGDKGMIDDELYQSFQRLGTAHVLAVSGLHIGIVYSFAVFITGNKKRKISKIFTICTVLIYILLAGFSPSTVRAGTMIFLHMLASRLRFRYDLLSAACFVMTVNLIINPAALFNLGFQLSYLAIFTLAVITHRITAGKNSTLKASIGIQAGLAPITAYSFNYFSWIAVILNIPIIFLTGIIVPAAIVMLYLSLTPFEELFAFGAKALEVLCRLLVRINETAYLGGKTSSMCKSPGLLFMFLYYGILFYGCSESAFIDYKRKNYRKIAKILVCIILISLIFSFLAFDKADTAGLVFVDVGQGDCIHIRTFEGKNFLIDSGGSAFSDVGEIILKPYLLKNGCSKLDGVILTHLHLDHSGGLQGIYQDIEINTVYVYAGYSKEDVLDILPGYSGSIAFLKRGDILRLGADVNVEILAPLNEISETDYENENSYSLIAKLSYNGVTALMTADIDSEGERIITEKIPPEKLKSDILKIAHHGSKYSSSEEFLRSVSPAAAVIQVGKNNYGHPADSVLEKCCNFGIIVYRNDYNGAVYIYNIKSGKYSIGTVIKQTD